MPSRSRAGTTCSGSSSRRAAGSSCGSARSRRCTCLRTSRSFPGAALALEIERGADRAQEGNDEEEELAEEALEPRALVHHQDDRRDADRREDELAAHGVARVPELGAVEAARCHEAEVPVGRNDA